MSIEAINEKLDKHIETDNVIHRDLQASIDNMKDNHLAHLKEDLYNVKTNLGVVKTDVSWLKKAFWVILTASVGGLIAGLINLLTN